ncbi:GntR family transcriptional regulator [Rhizobium sp. EC-SD404]|uniref:GntR family transcriptional regulator n=1 Tax=Rhizobium sp. EC-SD404 TaxID=2038389 RepID=UPI00125F909C|nr:GntR family transcriptional regulator [Rhizobium sp. EC-SD404]
MRKITRQPEHVMLTEPQSILSRPSLHVQLIDHLRQMIVEGTLAPGRKIPERELCERFGVSRTPLREALKVLASEGLVRLLPNRGAIVHALTIEELHEVAPIMEALEGLCGEIAAKHVSDEEIDSITDLHLRMVSHFRAGELQPYFALNQQIHQALFIATRNEMLQTLYRGLSTRLMAARYHANISPTRWAEAVREHDEILAALSSRDAQRLAAILRSHLANTLSTVGDWLRNQDHEQILHRA